MKKLQHCVVCRQGPGGAAGAVPSCFRTGAHHFDAWLPEAIRYGWPAYTLTIDVASMRASTPP